MTTRIERGLFLQIIADATHAITAKEWQTQTSTAKQLLDRDTVQSVTELIQTLSPP